MKEHRELTTRVQEVGELESTVHVRVPPPPTINYRVDPNTEGEAHLRDYWRSVVKHKWLVIGITLLITMISAIYMARKPDIFEAQSRVQVDLENADPSLGSSKSSSIIVNTRGVNDPAYFNTQLQILTSPGLLRRVVKTLDLEHNQAFLRTQNTQTRSTWQSLLRMVGLGGKEQPAEKNPAEDIPLAGTPAPASAREDLVEAKRLAPYVATILAGLKVEPVKETRLQIRDTRLIDVTYSHPDPQVAAKIVNAIADVFALANFERKTETNTTTGDFLQQRIAQLQSQIRTGEEQLVNYAKNHQILSLDANQNTVVERLAGLNRQLMEAENERIQAESAYRAALAKGASEAIVADTNKSIADSESKLNDLRQKLEQLLVDNTEEWPEVKETRKQIEVLEKHIKDTRKNASSTVVTNLETRYKQALAREQALRENFNKQRGETLSQNEAAINYRIIQQEIETNKSLLDGLLQRSKENDVVLAGRPNNIHVIDYAISPESPVGPRRLRSIGLALVLSLGLGIGLALFLEYLDDTVRSADDVEKMLHLPALAIIPTVDGKSRRRLKQAAGGVLQVRGNGNGSANTELVIHADARSPLAEAYRQLRTSVLLSTAGRAPKTLLVTSSMPSEGKTTTAVNLASSLAQTGASVLVVDADMRRPRLHNIFETEKGKGLSTILSSEMTDAEVFAIIEQDETSGLHLLTSGPVPPNPAELIGSDQMRRLIGTLSATFTHIIIDSPPVASFTDGVLIASMVDGVLLVVHGGRSSRDVVRRSRQLLLDVGAKIFGVVLNNVSLRPHDYYYQSYYQNSYYKVDQDADAVASER